MKNFLGRLVSFAALVCIGSFALRAQQMPAPTVGISTVETAQAVEKRRFTGLLQSPSRVSLVVRVAGELEEVGFKDGDVVEKGQMLYRLDDVRYDAAVRQSQASVDGCKAALAYSESNYNRLQSLYDKNVTTKDALEAALMTYQADKAKLAAAQAQLITAKDDLKNTTVTAPIAGKIGLNNFTVGNYLTPSSGELATLVQLDPLRLSFSMSNRDFLKLFGSSEAFIKNADVTICLADGSEYGEKATFEFFNNEGNRTTDTRQIYMLIPNKAMDLIPNSTVSVLLKLHNSEEECTILPSALLNDAKGSYVYVVDDQNTAIRRDIVPGVYDGNKLFVKSGLTAGERVITEGTHKVVPNSKVAIAQ